MDDAKKEQLLRRLQIAAQCGSDVERSHSEADDVLCEALKLLGHEDLVNEWHKVEKWYA